mmetsp:Transcript_48763/g.135697  ORF Transcript_48763/g.135697 Transcript_48763/m.135697 type:complete len:251 (+) Transcript_48763:96-848(+)
MELFTSRKLRRNMFLMTFVWFGFGVAYFGLVLLLPRIFEESTTEAPLSINSTALGTNVTEAASRLLHEASCELTFNFADISLSALMETVSVGIAICLIDRSGRTKTQGIMYFTGAASALVLGFRTLDIRVLTVAACVGRAAMMAASCATWVHTPELFPTSVRAEAHGILNLVSKSGAFFAQFLISDAFSQVACGGSMAAIAGIAGLAAISLPETAGAELKDELSDESGGEEETTADSAASSNEDLADDNL